MAVFRGRRSNTSGIVTFSQNGLKARVLSDFGPKRQKPVENGPLLIPPTGTPIALFCQPFSAHDVILAPNVICFYTDRNPPKQGRFVIDRSKRFVAPYNNDVALMICRQNDLVHKRSDIYLVAGQVARLFAAHWSVMPA